MQPYTVDLAFEHSTGCAQTAALGPMLLWTNRSMSLPTTEDLLIPHVRRPISHQASPEPFRSVSTPNIDKLALIFVAVVIVYAATRSLCHAVIRPLWFDEICTWLIVQQHPISVFWNALRDGVDGQPPLFYLLERPLAAAVANEQVSFRLLSIFGFSCTLACLFSLIRRRNCSVNALFCAAIPLATVLYDTYAVEGRPYTLFIACIAAALLCYDHAPEAGWMVLMGLSLAAAQALHYYAVLAFTPFILAEMALTLGTRRPRLRVWLALCFGAIPLAVFWQLVSRLKTYYGEHLWAKPNLLEAQSSYGWFFHTTSAWGTRLAEIAALGVLLTMFVAEHAAARGKHYGGPPFHARVLALGFLGLPFISFLAAKLIHGQMTARYMLPAILGFPLAAGYTLPRWSRRSAPLLAGFALCLVSALALQENRFWSYYKTDFISPAKAVEALAASANYGNLPIVVSDPHDFLQLAHYASPDWAKRFVSVIDIPQAVVYSGSDSADRELAAIRSYSHLQIYDFAPFVVEHPVFLLYSGNGGAGLDWWPPRLLQDGYTLRPLAVKDIYHRIFLVSRKENPEPRSQGVLGSAH
jgi:hypothetical protein